MTERSQRAVGFLRDPFSEMDLFERLAPFARVPSRSLLGDLVGDAAASGRTFAPPVDINENEDAFVVTIRRGSGWTKLHYDKSEKFASQPVLPVRLVAIEFVKINSPLMRRIDRTLIDRFISRCPAALPNNVARETNAHKKK